MYIGTKNGVVRAAAIKRRIEPQRFVWDEFASITGTPWKPMPRAARDGEEAPATRYPIASGGDDVPPEMGPAVGQGPSGTGGPRRVYIRASGKIDKYGTTPGCPRCQAILASSRPRAHGEECRQRITEEMLKEDMLARRLRDAEDPRATRAAAAPAEPAPVPSASQCRKRAASTDLQDQELEARGQRRDESGARGSKDPAPETEASMDTNSVEMDNERVLCEATAPMV